MKKSVFLLPFLFLLCVGCSGGSKGPNQFCKGASASSYSKTFQVSCPTMRSNYTIPTKYGCSPGQGISPPIHIEGIPEGTERLLVMAIDATCSYDCDKCCQFLHWAFDFPVSAMNENGPIYPDGVKENVAKDKAFQKYLLRNTFDKKAYMPFCPPKDQMHAYIFRVIAYKGEGSKKEITGRAQSVPLLFSFEQ